MSTSRKSTTAANENKQRNRVRGLMGAVRARTFASNPDVKAIEYRFRLRETLLAARIEVAPANYDAHLAWLRKQTEDQLPLQISRKAIGYHSISGIVKSPALPLSTELRWVASRLAAEAEQISRFRKLADALEDSFWRGDRSRLRALFLVIGRMYGQSLWLIENKLAIVQHFEGLESQKRFADSIKSKRPRSILSYIAHYISAKNEPSSTPLRFEEALSARIDRSRYSKFVKTYLRYRLIRHWPSSASDLSSILRAEQSHGVCDLYETFVALAQHLASTSTDAATLSALKLAFGKLDKIEDWRLDKLAAVLSVPRGFSALEDGALEAQDALLRGDTRIAYRLARQALKRRPADASQAVIAAYALASANRTKSPSTSLHPWSFVIDRLATLFAKRDGFERAVTDLLKFSRNFGGLPSARGLSGICLREGWPRSSASEDAGRIKSMNRRYLDPNDALAFDDFSARGAIRKLSQTGSLSVAFVEAMRFGTIVPSGVQPHFARIAVARYKARVGDYLSAYHAIVPNLSGEPNYLWLLSSKLASEYLISANDRAAALEIIGTVCALNERAANCLPIPEVIGGAQWQELEPFSDSLSLSIAIDQFWRHTNNDEAATLRRFSYEEFLFRVGVERPTQLGTILDKFSLKQLVYFLRNVCVQTVMEMSVDIASSRGLDEERREVCSLLCELDPENTETYQQEIFDISNKLVIQDGLRVVDSSRIYVDFDGILRRADKELRESFARYRDLVEAGIGIADDFETVLRSLIKQDYSTGNYFTVPSNEADDLLIRMFFALRDAFLFDAAHGLDSYLSKRVRHGSIPNYLRSPVENAQLITQRATGADTYKRNEYWLNKLGSLSVADADNVQSSFVAFAKKFDAMIIELKDELLQLFTPDHPRGFFQIVLTAPAVHLLRSAVQSELSFTTFVRSCFDIFWTLLEPSLAATRAHLREVTKAQVAQAFDKLRADLLIAIESNAELSMEIGAASTEVQRRAESIAEWFNRPDGRHSSQTYTLEQVIDIAVESALNSMRTFRPKITKSVGSGYGIPSNGLVMVNEIIWVALENVHRRSGVDGQPWVEIDAAVLPEKEVLSVRVKSEVKPGVRSDETEKKLAGMRARISDGSFRELVRKEVNSGFFKIASQVSDTPRGKIIFGFEDDDTFCLEVDLSSIVYNGSGGDAPGGKADAVIVG